MVNCNERGDCLKFYVFRANLYKYFITLYRAYPRSFFIGSLLTLFSTVLFSWMLYDVVFMGELDPSFSTFAGTEDYMTYVVIGSLVYSFTVATLLNVSRSLITEQRIGTLESVFLTPYNRGMYFLAYMVAQTFHKFGEMIAAMPILLLFGIRFPGFNMGGFLLVLVVTLYSFLGLSLLLANVMLYTRDTYISQNTLFAVIFLVCGITFPREYLPAWVAGVSVVLPVTYSTDLFRGVILGSMGFREMMYGIGMMVLLGTVYCILGFWLLPHVERLAIENTHG